MGAAGKLRELLEADWLGLPLCWAQALLDAVLPNDDVFRNVRAVAFKCLGLRVSWTSKVGRRVTVTDRRKFRSGRGTHINHEAYFDCHRPIAIGSFCDIGYRTTFVTAGHELVSDFASVRPLSDAASKPITVEDFVWIGANATVLPGVTIGRGSVVAAGAVVTRDVEPYTLVAGVPARKVRSLSVRPDERPVRP